MKKKVLWNACESQWPVLTLVNLDDLSCLMLRKSDSQESEQSRGERASMRAEREREREREEEEWAREREKRKGESLSGAR